MTLFLAELEVIKDFFEKLEVMALFYKGTKSQDWFFGGIGCNNLILK